jgi:DNA uptake protein ComE-like DNA-binding protein
MNRPIVPVTLVGVAVLTIALVGCSKGEGRYGDSAQGGATAAVAAAGASAASTAPAPTGAFLDPDAATRDELAAVPGMNATTADAVIAGRPYQNMTAVDRVLSGAKLTEQQRDTIYTRLWKPIDLNTASKEEILLIPGVGPRMLREFEEYRPYQSIEKFRREIGKYVKPDEVARLERYVTIRGR